MCAVALGREITFGAARYAGQPLLRRPEGSFCLTADYNVSSCYEAFVEEAPWAKLFPYGAPDDEGGYRFDRARLERLSRYWETAIAEAYAETEATI